MAIALNLSRDVRVWVSTVETGFTAADTFEVRVLDGFTVNQGTETTDVTIDEAGDAPARGKKTFSTQLNPVEMSFSTYARPYVSGGNQTAVEKILWEGLVTGEGQPSGVTESATDMTVDFSNSNQHEMTKLFVFVEFGSGADQLRYKVTEAIVGQVDIEFDINGIATLSWSLQGSTLVQVSADELPGAGSTTFTPAPASAFFIKNKLSSVAVEGNYSAYYTTGLAGALGATTATTLGADTYDLDVDVDNNGVQQLSVALGANATLTDIAVALTEAGDGTFAVEAGAGTLTFKSLTYGGTSEVDVAAGTAGSSGGDLLAALNALAEFSGTPFVAGTSPAATNQYNVPITGGSLSINNNVTFLTPEELGIVNTPIGHFTGTRDVSGTLTAYLRTGTADETAQLQQDLLTAKTVVTTSFDITVAIGGAANTPRIEFALPQAFLSIPSTETEDVMSTTIEFSGLPTALDSTDEASITYVVS